MFILTTRRFMFNERRTARPQLISSKAMKCAGCASSSANRQRHDSCFAASEVGR
jgi:hypothetical protein